MSEQNQTPGTDADDTEGHVHFRISEVDDAAGHAFRRDDEDVSGHVRARDDDSDDSDDDTEGHARRI